MHKLITIASAGLFVCAFSFSGIVEAQDETRFSLSKKEAAAASIDAESAELSADAVVTTEDLSRFATSRMKRDAQIEHVEASSGKVSVEYRKKAHFLGFIPGSIGMTAEVESGGTVDVDYPWYRFLFVVDGANDTESELRTQASDIMASADPSAGFNAHTQAQLIFAIIGSLDGLARM